jgi:hypothetical protein
MTTHLIDWLLDEEAASLSLNLGRRSFTLHPIQKTGQKA